MGNVYECDAELVMHGLELNLHLFSHLEVKCTQRLIQKKDLRLIYKRSCYGDTLLLASGKSCYAALLEAFQVNHFKNVLNLLIYLAAVHLLELEAEGNIVIDIHVGKKCIALEHRINGALIGREFGYILSAEKDLTAGRPVEACDHPKSCSLAASGRAKESNELTSFNGKIKIIYRNESVVIKSSCDIPKFDYGLRGSSGITHFLSPRSGLSISNMPPRGFCHSAHLKSVRAGCPASAFFQTKSRIFYHFLPMHTTIKISIIVFKSALHF